MQVCASNVSHSVWEIINADYKYVSVWELSTYTSPTSLIEMLKSFVNTYQLTWICTGHAKTCSLLCTVYISPFSSYKKSISHWDEY